MRSRLLSLFLCASAFGGCTTYEGELDLSDTDDSRGEAAAPIVEPYQIRPLQTDVDEIGLSTATVIDDQTVVEGPAYELAVPENGCLYVGREGFWDSRWGFLLLYRTAEDEPYRVFDRSEPFEVAVDAVDRSEGTIDWSRPQKNTFAYFSASTLPPDYARTAELSDVTYYGALKMDSLRDGVSLALMPVPFNHEINQIDGEIEFELEVIAKELQGAQTFADCTPR